jgi:AraC family transcriptional regulator of adaptative response/methylated-DNA-[protein]-cysteine methyltransferase
MSARASAQPTRLQGWHAAVKLINAGALDANPVVTLAMRLGISSRHLARLFERHVGATPRQLARTLRVQRAKRLLDSGDHTMTDIAFQAGFGSLRRFNAAFAGLYGRSPSRLRIATSVIVQKKPGLRSSP